ncbi:MAG: PaaI family thioesterase [Pseudomonadota bacterium]
MRIEIPETLDEWNARGADFLPGHLGLVFDKVDADEVVGRFEVRQPLQSWNGFLHAGAVVTLADTCCGYGTLKNLPDDANGFTTIDLNSNFLGTALEGEVVCSATPLHLGRTTQVWDASVVSAATGRRMAQFRCAQMILRPKG